MEFHPKINTELPQTYLKNDQKAIVPYSYSGLRFLRLIQSEKREDRFEGFAGLAMLKIDEGNLDEALRNYDLATKIQSSKQREFIEKMGA